MASYGSGFSAALFFISAAYVVIDIFYTVRATTIILTIPRTGSALGVHMAHFTGTTCFVYLLCKTPRDPHRWVGVYGVFWECEPIFILSRRLFRFREYQYGASQGLVFLRAVPRVLFWKSFWEGLTKLSLYTF
jgi:hypothetical protein